MILVGRLVHEPVSDQGLKASACIPDDLVGCVKHRLEQPFQRLCILLRVVVGFCYRQSRHFIVRHVRSLVFIKVELCRKSLVRLSMTPRG